MCSSVDFLPPLLLTSWNSGFLSHMVKCQGEEIPMDEAILKLQAIGAFYLILFLHLI